MKLRPSYPLLTGMCLGASIAMVIILIFGL
jgi:hypothetical protein